MTPRTRRRLTLCLVLGLFTLPAEALLYPVAKTPDAAVAANAYVAGLSAEEIQQASLDIDHYPAVYRKAILTELTPADRSVAWRNQFQKYLASHPQLSAEQAAVVREAIDVASPVVFTAAAPMDQRTRAQQVFKRATSLLGAKDASELFVTLGPKVVTQGNALPLTQRIADNIRGWRVVNAEYPDCNCNIEMDTCDLLPDPWLQCSELYTCKFDLEWPMCGPFWSWACTGWCKVLRWPSIN